MNSRNKREPIWISKRLVLVIHDRQLVEHGGLAGFRDEGLLESALAAPQHRFHYGISHIAELAAVYAHAIIRNHPFNDGNKRAAFVVAVTFLEWNGWRFSGREAEAVEMTLALAARELDEAGFAAWLKANSARRKKSK